MIRRAKIYANITVNTKAMSKLKSATVLYHRLRILVVVLAVAGLVGGANLASADQYDNQINALQAQNNTAQNTVNGLATQASSYQGAISNLQNQVAALQAAIQANQGKQAQLQQQIAADKQEVAQKKSSLSDDIKTMYVDGQMTTIEELATSKNLSDYVDKEEYRTSVQNQLDATIKSIASLEAQLQQQQTQLAIVVKSEQQQNGQLAADESQQQQLLAYNQGQQAAYNQQIQANQKQIAVLRQEQILANQRLVNSGGGHVIASGSCGGGYPADAINSYGGHWGCNYPLDNTLDNWGMYNRECVSFAAWKVYQAYGYMPYWGGSGDANQWPADARAAGISTGSTPKVGSVAIYMGGSGDPWGHAMWVVGVSGGMITVQQYNLYYDGNYYETTVPASGLVYIYFGG